MTSSNRRRVPEVKGGIPKYSPASSGCEGVNTHPALRAYSRARRRRRPSVRKVRRRSTNAPASTGMTTSTSRRKTPSNSQFTAPPLLPLPLGSGDLLPHEAGDVPVELDEEIRPGHDLVGVEGLEGVTEEEIRAQGEVPPRVLHEPGHHSRVDDAVGELLIIAADEPFVVEALGFELGVTGAEDLPNRIKTPFRANLQERCVVGDRDARGVHIDAP